MDSPGLFVIVVPLALGYSDALIADPVDEPVLIVDPPAPFPFRAVLQRLGLPFTGKRFTLDGPEQAVYLFQRLFILRLPVEVFLPCVFGKCDFTHAPWPPVLPLSLRPPARS